MAKINFSKFGLKKKTDIKTKKFFDQDVEIKQYLPIEEKLSLLETVLNKALDNSEFFNPAQVSVFFKLEVIKKYTNINFTKTQLEDFSKTYDLMESNGLFKMIMDEIPVEELSSLEDQLIELLDSVYSYKLSAYGILNSLKENYNNMDIDLTKLQEKVADPETLGLLKEIAPMLDLA